MSGELPEGWATATLGEIAEINPRHPRGLDDSMVVSFAPMAAISDSKPTFQLLEQRPLSEIRKGFTHFAEGDVLFAKITPCMENGKGAVASGLSNGLGCGTTELHVIRPRTGIDPYYVYRFLAQPSVRQEAKENFTGTAGQARVPTAFIESLEIPLAPPAEQRRIAAKLETVLGKVDACQERLGKFPALLKRFRQSVLAAACSGRLTEDWREGKALDQDSWSTAILGKVADLRLGKMLDKAKNIGGPTPYLRNINVRWFEFDVSDLALMRATEHDKRELAIKDGDLLVCEGGEPGRCAVWRNGDNDLIFQKAIHRVRPNETVSSGWLAFQIKNDANSARLDEYFTGSTIKHLTGQSLARYEFALPTLSEQEEIVRRVEALFALADQIETRYAKAQARVDQLTPSLLTKAFRGELVATEAELAHKEGREYESATVLLECTRAGRESSRAVPKAIRSRAVRRTRTREGSH